MGLMFESTWWAEALVGLLLLLWWFYRFLTKDYGFWAERGVPFVKPVFPYGSLKDLVLNKVYVGQVFDQVYKQFPNERYCGVIELNRPVLVIRDPDLVKEVLVKEFNCFVDRALFEIDTGETMNRHLFLLDGDEWRRMRHKLSPAFSSGKMKHMFQLMVRCGEQLDHCLDEVTSHATATVDVKEMFAKFTMDIIATCAFGVELNSLKDENTAFYRTASLIFKLTAFTMFKRRFQALFPALAKLLGVRAITKSITDMINSLVVDTVKYRKENNVTRKDFMDILISLKNNKSILDGSESKDELVELNDNSTGREGLTIDEMAAQSFIFFGAGFETAASTLTFCLYELARHPEVQRRLWREVRETLDRHEGRLTYQALQEMAYMDQVINETLRMYSSLSVLNRRCTRACKLNGTDLVLQPGQRVCIPIYAIHHDPKYFPDPLRFDPERFNAENSRGRHSCVYLPFGTGPRNCIGLRFGLMQTKVGLSTLVSRYVVGLSPQTPQPIRLMAAPFVTQPDSPVRLTVCRRSSD